MYEEIAPARKGAFRAVFLIIICAFLLLSLPEWLRSYNTFFLLPYATAIYELFVFLFGAIAVFYFVRHYATEYRYCLLDSTLIIKGKTGMKETMYQQLALADSTCLMPMEQADRLIREMKWKRRKISYGVSDRATAYLLTFQEGNERNAIIFQPSDKFVELLKQFTLDKPDKM